MEEVKKELNKLRDKLISMHFNSRLSTGDFSEIMEIRNQILILCEVSRSNAINYSKGFELAMDFIDKHPADPDITSEQLSAWIKLQDFIKYHKER